MPKVIIPYIAPTLCCSVCGKELRRMPQQNKEDIYEHQESNWCPVAGMKFSVYAGNQVQQAGN
jgi:hypothetical protein